MLRFPLPLSAQARAGVEVAMTCMRCQGLLVEIPSLFWVCPDWEPHPAEELQRPAWQCVNCGDYIDAVILAYRASPSLTAGELVCLLCDDRRGARRLLVLVGSGVSARKW